MQWEKSWLTWVFLSGTISFESLNMCLDLNVRYNWFFFFGLERQTYLYSPTLLLLACAPPQYSLACSAYHQSKAWNWQRRINWWHLGCTLAKAKCDVRKKACYSDSTRVLTKREVTWQILHAGISFVDSRRWRWLRQNWFDLILEWKRKLVSSYTTELVGS